MSYLAHDGNGAVTAEDLIDFDRWYRISFYDAHGARRGAERFAELRRRQDQERAAKWREGQT